MSAINATDPAVFEILHALKVKGLASDTFLGDMTGLDDASLATAVTGVVENGWAIRRDTPRMSGTMITPAGRAEYDRRSAEAALDDAVLAQVLDIYEKFLPINSDFKKVCAAWQMTADGTPNDHSDATYDAGVIGDLGGIHERVAVALAPADTALPRLYRYAGRLEAALEKVRGGDSAAFARPMYDSYHDIWMELHQDLLLTTGREREAADEE